MGLNVGKLDFIKIKNLHHQEITLRWEKERHELKIFSVHLHEKDFFIIYKKILPINKEKRDNTISKMGNRLEQTFHKREYPNGQYSYKGFLGIIDQRSAN